MFVMVVEGFGLFELDCFFFGVFFLLCYVLDRCCEVFLGNWLV